jgi:D-glycero-D-manno-heptose 1,7-bisphosphate phosphatase
MNKAVFIDKDGTLVKDVPYNVDPALVAYPLHTMEALRLLQDLGYVLIIVSNQSGIAKGYFSEWELTLLINKIQLDMEAQRIRIAAFYYCPHFPDTIIEEFAKSCTCRKPQPGMLLQAAEDFEIDLSRSWMIGDILDDMEAGKKAGCKTILLNVGNETEWKMDRFRVPDYNTQNMLEAANIILNDLNTMAG